MRRSFYGTLFPHHFSKMPDFSTLLNFVTTFFISKRIDAVWLLSPSLKFV